MSRYEPAIQILDNAKQATQSAMSRLGYRIKAEPPVDPQLFLDLEAAIKRTKKNGSPGRPSSALTSSKYSHG
jgi:hypothetical protein